MKAAPAVELAPWSDDDLPLLVRLNAPEMTEHLGGPETTAQVEARHRRYLAAASSDTVHVYKVVLLPEGAPVGGVNFWEREWRGETVYEMGWGVLPEFQGRGIASSAVDRAIALARADGRCDQLHAFPSIHNAPSNGICRRLGFELLGEVDFEYPKGSWMRCNDWRIRLR